MKTTKTLLLFSLMLIGLNAFSQVTVIVNALPANTLATDDIYMSGNMNSWNAGDSNFHLTKLNATTYRINLNNTAGIIQFRFNRNGLWANVETDLAGNDINNRTFSIGTADTLYCQIAAWKNSNAPVPSTANANVTVSGQQFFIPQLNQNCSVSIFFPSDYTTTTKQYRVMYMQDGEQLFDNNTATSSEWQVDEALVNMEQQGDAGCIVVAISVSATMRNNLYSPFVNPNYGGGQGDDYVDFIINTLKPYIDSTYRTYTDASHTGIFGSDMGAFIALYAGIKHPEVFGKVGALSPSLYFAAGMMNNFILNQPKAVNSKIYFACGDNETSAMLPQLNITTGDMASVGYVEGTDFVKNVRTGVTHDVSFWRNEFTTAYNWMWGNNAVGIESMNTTNSSLVYPNPATSTLNINAAANARLSVYNSVGQLVISEKVVAGNNQLNTSDLQNGFYQIVLEGNNSKETHAVVVAH